MDEIAMIRYELNGVWEIRTSKSWTVRNTCAEAAIVCKGFLIFARLTE